MQATGARQDQRSAEGEDPAATESRRSREAAHSRGGRVPHRSQFGGEATDAEEGSPSGPAQLSDSTPSWSTGANQKEHPAHGEADREDSQGGTRILQGYQRGPAHEAAASAQLCDLR